MDRYFSGVSAMQMTKLGAIAIGLWVLFSINRCHAIEPCQPLSRTVNSQGRVQSHFEVWKAGTYCLVEDITSHRVFAIAEGGEKGLGGHVGYVHSSNVGIDLMGHKVNAESIGTSGLEVAGAHGLIQGVAVKNGIIRSRTGWGVQFNGALEWNLNEPRSEFFRSSRTSPELRKINEKDYQEFLALKQKLKIKFPITAHRIENLKISAVYRPLEIRGAGNVIKGSRFESTVHSIGLDLSGPNQVVEGNTIVVQAEPGKGAAIVLNMADNSVIRNNTIVIEGGGNHPNAAISIVDSKNVLIENNKIIGTPTLYEIWDEEAGQESRVIQRGNDFPTLWKRLLGLWPR